MFGVWASASFWNSSWVGFAYTLSASAPTLGAADFSTDMDKNSLRGGSPARPHGVGPSAPRRRLKSLRVFRLRRAYAPAGRPDHTASARAWGGASSGD